MKSNLTFVTALYDIGRGELDSGFSRSFEHYMECFSRLLEIDYNLLIYVDESLEDWIWERRDRKNTVVVVRNTDTLKDFPFYKQVQDIRAKDEWIGQSGWIPDSTQAKLDMYNPLVMSKHFMLNDATWMNPFNSEYFMWVDAGLSNTIGDPKYYFDENYEKKIRDNLNKMYYIAFPYDGQIEVHGFEKNAMNRYAGEETEYVCRGGLFGGNKESINEFNEYYYHLLNSTLNEGLMGTEETIFTIMTYLHKEKCHIEMIEDNGLIITYLERIKNQKLDEYDDRIAIYVLTYNLPKQLELWCKSFEKYKDLEHSRQFKKYLINNSTEEEHREEYIKLIEKYDFEEFEFDNIGICGGRQFASEHFDESKHKYMVFFEDDMLLSHKNRNDFCKNGLTTNVTQLFSKSIDILEREKLDYLKFNFTEFYGDNHKNWAWDNVPMSKKAKYFTERKSGLDEKKTKVYYTGTVKGTSYAVGEYHYCNWPLLFNKEGNRKVFLETKFANPYEQTWMSFVMGKMVEGKIKAGCLLASPIFHYRKYHYTENTRKENKNG